MDLGGVVDKLFQQILNLGTGAGVAVAAVFFMWGAFQLMSAGGSPRQMESGKQAMWHAVAGLALVLVAHTIARWLGSYLPPIGS